MSCPNRGTTNGAQARAARYTWMWRCMPSAWLPSGRRTTVYPDTFGTRCHRGTAALRNAEHQESDSRAFRVPWFPRNNCAPSTSPPAPCCKSGPCEPAAGPSHVYTQGSSGSPTPPCAVLDRSRHGASYLWIEFRLSLDRKASPSAALKEEALDRGACTLPSFGAVAFRVGRCTGSAGIEYMGSEIALAGFRRRTCWHRPC